MRTWLCFACILFLCARVRADDALREAEGALVAGDHGSAAARARSAIEAGTRSGAELAPLFLVLASASALLGDEETARRAFTALLALQPSFRLADERAELRSPYMEARGFWSLHAVPLRVALTRSEDGTTLVAQVVDAAGLAARVRVRVAHDARFVELMRPAEAQVSLPFADLPVSEQLAYTLALLDEHGNRLWQAGSEQAPLRLAGLTTSAPPALTPAAHKPAEPLASGAHWLWGAGTLAVGVGASASAAWTHAQREDLAERWNAGDCTGEGTTRAERCADEKQRLVRMERASYALLGVGVAGLVTGVVLLALPRRERTRSAAQPRAWSCGALERARGLQCAAEF